MRMKFAALAALIFSAPAHGEPLPGKDIEPLLNNTTVYGLPLGAQSWRQSFAKNGETIYVDASGAKTYGDWLVRGGTYCSLWPPSDRWSCYPMESVTSADGHTTVSWISGGGGPRYEALLTPGLHIDEAAPPN